MNTRRSIAPILSMLGIMALLAIGAGSAPLSEPIVPSGFAHPLFEQQWNYTDKSVQQGRVSRSWVWGEVAGQKVQVNFGNQPLLVQYFDKARMEVLNPGSEHPTVTNGRLVVEMITGQIQTGPSTFLPVIPSTELIAGDPNNFTPTYATLYSVVTSKFGGLASAPQPMSSNAAFNNSLNLSGTVGTADPSVRNLVNIAGGEKSNDICTGTIPCGQNIPGVFWNFLNQTGEVSIKSTNGTYSYYSGRPVFADWQKPASPPVTAPNWISIMGLPITEPYWVQITILGRVPQVQWVLFQAFERRVLTYNPNNPPAWRVEMGNVGLQYKDWRNRQPEAPNLVGALVIQATSGSATEVCSKYPDSANCNGQAYAPTLSKTILHPGSWARTKRDANMVLASTSTVYNLMSLAKITFKPVSDDATASVVNHESGRVDYVHTPNKDTLTVEANHGVVVEATDSLFSVVVTGTSVITTNTVRVAEPSFGIKVVVPSKGGRVRVQANGVVITVTAGRQLTIEEGTPPKLEPISQQEEDYWVQLLERLKGIPNTSVILQNSLNPASAVVVQATSGSTTEVCSKYPDPSYTSCSEKTYEPNPYITRLQSGSWARTTSKGSMTLVSMSTIFHLGPSAHISFQGITDGKSVTTVTQDNGRVDYVQDPTMPRIVIHSSALPQYSLQWIIATGNLFSVIITDTASVGEPRLFVAASRYGGGDTVGVSDKSGSGGWNISPGTQLTLGENSALQESSSAQEAEYFANLLPKLNTIPSLRVILENNNIPFP